VTTCCPYAHVIPIIYIQFALQEHKSCYMDFLTHLLLDNTVYGLDELEDIKCYPHHLSCKIGFT